LSNRGSRAIFVDQCLVSVGTEEIFPAADETVRFTLLAREGEA
jgi:hypothetical protein